MTPEPKPDAVRRQAGVWFERRQADILTVQDEAAFQAWLAESPAHARAYAVQEALWKALPAVPAAAAFNVEAALQHRQRPSIWRRAQSWLARPVVPAGLAAGAAALFAVALVLPVLWEADVRQAERSAPERVHATEVAELREIALGDGSRVTLGGRSRIDVAFTPEMRRVILAEGEALFSVVSDASRPFIVEAGDTVVRVVGTEFDMRRGVSAVRVAVLKGEVEVLRRQDVGLDAPPRGVSGRTLLAGEAVSAPISATPISAALALPEAAPIDVNRAAAWRQGRLVYENARLEEVIADANRYFDAPIRFGDDALRDLRVTASFRTDQIDQMLSGLEGAHPIRARRQASGAVTLEPSAR